MKLAPLAAAVAVSWSFAAEPAPRLLQQPTLAGDRIVFATAGDLWSVPHAGGAAVRLTSSPGIERDPHASPDGRLLAFTGEYDGNVDVFVMPVEGGVPRRLTHHPGDDLAIGWSPDGKRILFRSARAAHTFIPRLYTVPLEGGLPTELPLPYAQEGSYSPDGRRLAYVPTMQWQPAWKQYRGGQTTPIWIVDLETLAVEKVPRDNSNDRNPVWIGETVWFLSDRNDGTGLFAYDTRTRAVREVLPAGGGFDLKAIAGDPSTLVVERFGSLERVDPASGRATPIEIRVAGDFPEVRRHLVKIPADATRGWDLSPGGARAAFEARGEILTVPAEKGDIRNLTRTSGAAERDPAWSPDGKRVACFSDAGGEYALEIRDALGKEAPKRIALGDPPSFFYSPSWSPDGKKIVYTDKRLNLWYVGVDGGAPVKVDTNTYDGPFRVMDPAWSPDSKWIAYAKELPSRYHAIFAHSLDLGMSAQITDGLSDALHPVFDAGGKVLFFTASTDIGPTQAWLDLSSVNRPVSRSVYLAVLSSADPSPFAPESDEDGKPEDKDKDADKEKHKDEKVQVKIDLEGISQRILALPLPAKGRFGLAAGKAGILFLVEGPVVEDPSAADGPPSFAVQRFDLAERKAEPFVEGITAFDVAAGGEKVLFRKDGNWVIAGADSPPKEDPSALALDGLEVPVDPRAEWGQMFREVWRLERDFFYDPGHHGLDLAAAERRYAPFLDGLASRADLNVLFEEMLANLVVGHMYVRGGDVPEVTRVPTGLLGADYAIEGGRYRFARVFDGENWNPELRAPLTQPGALVRAGEYLLAVDGREVTARDEVYAFFVGTADKQVAIRVGPTPDGKGARDVTVVPIASEAPLRNRAWIEDNRRTVERLSGGRLGYAWLPNTGGGGYRNFNRYFFPQIGKQGFIVDERYNTGGLLADYVIDFLRRPPMSGLATREGADQISPSGAVQGPKVLIVNEFAGSGGDALPWYFRKARIGPIVGKRTWGGLVGIYDYPALIDGGFVMAPRAALYGLDGEWEVENRGVAPDIEVEWDPKAWSEGRDPQLERAVQVALELLEKSPWAPPRRPAYPNYWPRRQP